MFWQSFMYDLKVVIILWHKDLLKWRRVVNLEAMCIKSWRLPVKYFIENFMILLYDQQECGGGWWVCIFVWGSDQRHALPLPGSQWQNQSNVINIATVFIMLCQVSILWLQFINFLILFTLSSDQMYDIDIEVVHESISRIR